ncbi:MAG: DUF1501 domain-containing protein [Phycisphaeraceae bacterium]|nr:DUF1501 domain-containing protein [Phycisphaeraceae bacterium]
MPAPDPCAFTRRRFISNGLTLASAAIAAPAFLQRTALALPGLRPDLSSLPGVPQDKILVVVQLSGGNDGLNTVVPFGDPAYYRARPQIGIAQRDALVLSQEQGIGLHPAMTGVKGLYDDGLCCVVQGVGYPNPNRSHFTSMDIWHTADTSATGDGWLGRYFDSECCGHGKGESGSEEPQGQPGIAIGRTAPLAMQGRAIKPIAFESPALFRWTGQDVHESLHEPYDALVSAGVSDSVDPGSNAAFLMRTALDAQISSDLIRRAVDRGASRSYPGTPLGQQLAMVAAMINAGLNTRVYYVSHGGFDTHAGQGGPQGQHANLLRTLGDAMKAFYDDLKRQENAERVLSMSFSEFGRRVGQNNSGGTDHGTAAPMFMFGPMVRSGILGNHPSLKDLDDGDLKFHIDFRTVYAAVLKDWMGAEPKDILDQPWRPAPIIRTQG